MRLQLKGERKAEILIYEDIGSSFFEDGITAKSFTQQLKALGDVDEINVRISSVGGNSWDAMAIYNALTRHPAEVVVDIDGIAASAASLVAMAASPGKLRMAANADLMIHRSHSIHAGDRNDMERMSGRLKDLDEKQLDIYASRASIDRDQLSALLDAETWFTAAEAKAIGLIDEVTGALKVAAKLNVKEFRKTPARVASRFKVKGDRQMAEKATELKAQIDEAVKAAVEPLTTEHSAAIAKMKADHEAEVASLKAGNKPPKKDAEPTIDELLTAERTRVKELHALASNASIKDQTTIDRWVDKKLSITEAKAEIGDLAIKQGKLSKTDDGGDDGNKEKGADRAARAEYRQHPTLHASLGHKSEDDYAKWRAPQLLAELSAA